MMLQSSSQSCAVFAPQGPIITLGRRPINLGSQPGVMPVVFAEATDAVLYLLDPAGLGRVQLLVVFIVDLSCLLTDARTALLHTWLPQIGGPTAKEDEWPAAQGLG